MGLKLLHDLDGHGAYRAVGLVGSKVQDEETNIRNPYIEIRGAHFRLRVRALCSHVRRAENCEDFKAQKISVSDVFVL